MKKDTKAADRFLAQENKKVEKWKLGLARMMGMFVRKKPKPRMYWETKTLKCGCSIRNVGKHKWVTTFPCKTHTHVEQYDRRHDGWKRKW